LTSQTNGNSSNHLHSRPSSPQKRRDPSNSLRPAEPAYLAPARINALSRKDSSLSETGSAPDSLLDLYGPVNNMDSGNKNAANGDIYGDEDPERSRWIHRDKLARIENQELQAAGIILPQPRSRAASKGSRHEHSRDGNGVRSEGQKRRRIGSSPAEEEEGQENMEWDLRTPEEAAEDQGEFYRDMSGGVKGISRIPISKTSPLPIPIDYLERDTPIARKQSGGWPAEEESISYAKSRGRSQSIKALDDTAATPTPANRLPSDNSPTKKSGPKKQTPANRVTSGQRLKAKAGREASGSQQRPSTRGELGPSGSINKRPEGDPPWLASMYKPDPRLPPDQQLLPTVAKRLQQEQWEKEGKFGNVYDTSFRPLNDDVPHPPENQPEAVESTPPKPEQLNPEWPLRSPGGSSPASPALSASGRPGTSGGGYSTMPKITPGIPQGLGPQQSPKPTIKMEEPPEKTKEGCGCCVVM